MKHAELIERLKDADAEEVMTTPLLEQAADAIESLQAEVERLTLACNKAAQAELDLLAERAALKLDAERYRKVKPLFKWDNEGGHGIWTCSIRDDLWGDSIDVSVDAMKGAT